MRRAIFVITIAVACLTFATAKNEKEGREEYLKELESLVHKVEHGLDKVYDAVSEGRSAHRVAGSVKRQISKAWVIVRQLDEVGAQGEALPLMKALQNAGKEVEVMITDAESESGSSKVNEDVERVLDIQEKHQDRQVLKLVAVAEKLVAEHEALNEQFRLLGAHGEVEPVPEAALKLIDLKTQILNDSKDL